MQYGWYGRTPQKLSGSERAEATTSVLSPSVISREWASCMTNTAGQRVREGTPPSERRSRSRRVEKF